MNPESQQPNPAQPGQGVTTPDQFKEWMKAPANAEKFYDMVAQINPPIPRDASPAEVAELRALAEKRRMILMMAPVHRKLAALPEALEWPAGTLLEKENRLAECQKLMAELTDALLEVPELQRTKCLKDLMPLREKIMAMKPD